MKGFVVVALIGALCTYVFASALRGQPWHQYVAMSWPFALTWLAWSVGYLMGPRRRLATLAVLARVSWRLRLAARLYRRRQRLAAARRLAAAPGDAA